MIDRKIKILCVDDVSSNLKLLEKILTSKVNCHVDTCLTGEEALDLHAKAPYDLILTDFKMDGLDGMQLLQQIKQSNEPTEVIMVTAFANIESAVEAIKFGALDYIEKPIQAKLLLKKVNELQKKLSQEESYEEQELGLLKVSEVAESNLNEMQHMYLHTQGKLDQVQKVLQESESLSKGDLLEELKQIIEK